MRSIVICLLAAWLCTASVAAANLKEGDREVAVRISQVDLDLGTLYGLDLGDETMRRYSASIGWMRTNRVQLGVELSWIDMDLAGLVPGKDVQGNGTALGGFLHTNFATKTKLTPFLGAGFSIFRGDMSELYQWDLELSAGLKVYAARRVGFLVAAGWNRLSPEEGVPAASGAKLSAGILFKF